MKLYPSLRYKDAKAAHNWLQDAFGFEPVAFHEDDGGNVAHAEMRWGSDLIMFGAARQDLYGDRIGLGWVYVTCDDPDAGRLSEAGSSSSADSASVSNWASACSHEATAAAAS